MRPPGAEHLWRTASAYAARAHEGQARRDGKTPYFSHPARVALTVATLFGCDDAETLAIALLHDTIEDGTTDYEDLDERFGKTIADGVVALTKDAALPEPVRETHAEARLRAGSWRPKLVKLADVLDNSADVAEGDGTSERDDAGRRSRLLARAVWAIDAARAEAETTDNEAVRERLTRAADLVNKALSPR